MRLQALAVAAIMQWDQSPHFHDIVIKPHPVLRHLPRLGQLLPNLPITHPGSPPLPALTTPDEFPDILITCGRRMAGVSIALKARAQRRRIKLTTIHLQDPRLSPNYFDILIVPQHDRVRGDNVIVTKAALNRLNQKSIAAAAAALPANWRQAASPRVAILFGGDNRRYKISDKMAENMIAQLKRYHHASGGTVFLVPSRRCPPALWQKLQAGLSTSNCLVADQNQPNPYPGVLALADTLIVTSDSVNMVSEAASTGKPVFVAYWTEERGRIGKFHKAMQAGNHTARLGTEALKNGFVPLDETAMVRQNIAARLT